MEVTLTMSREMFKSFFGRKPGTDPEICQFIKDQWNIRYPIGNVEWY